MHPSVDRFDRTLREVAPYMASTVSRAREKFGASWESRFGATLSAIFGEDGDRLSRATQGYVRFALDATRLQKRFDRERKYVPRTYDEAAALVYHNAQYMRELYLPGILLSHYLWPHHYRQLSFFLERFVPEMRAASNKLFFDVGVGTGFYSRMALSEVEGLNGVAFDISDHSLEFARMQVEAFQLETRLRFEKRDVIRSPVTGQAPFLISVEVLEHLEDPVAFLKALKGMLTSGGVAFVTAALTAPNADHIYLYNDCDEVIWHLNEAGFRVQEYQEDKAFEPKLGESVPRIAAFIVR